MDILVYKYNGLLHYQWDTALLEEGEDYILVEGEIGRKLMHYTKNRVFDCSTKSVEFFSTKEGFTINIDIDADGNVEYYCNICLPSKVDYDKNNISFTDLDLDLLIDNEGNQKVVDEDEFIQNSIEMKYPQEIIDYAKNSLAELEKKVGNKEFPFNGFFEFYISEVKENMYGSE